MCGSSSPQPSPGMQVDISPSLCPTAAVGIVSAGTRGRKGACTSRRSQVESKQLLPALLQQLLSHPWGMGWAGAHPAEDGSGNLSTVLTFQRWISQRWESSTCLGLKCTGIWKVLGPLSARRGCGPDPTLLRGVPLSTMLSFPLGIPGCCHLE